MTAAQTVAIIGAGPLGRQLALSAARAGYQVMLEDVMPANLRHAEEALRQQLGAELMPLITFATTVEDAVRNAELVIDCVPDELESKLEIFCLLDRMAPPRTVLVTPTTHLSIADLASCTYRPSQCVGVAVNAREISTLGIPGRMTGNTSAARERMPIRRTSQTSAEALDVVVDFWTRLGYEAVTEMDEAEKLLR